MEIKIENLLFTLLRASKISGKKGNTDDLATLTILYKVSQA